MILPSDTAWGTHVPCVGRLQTCRADRPASEKTPRDDSVWDEASIGRPVGHRSAKKVELSIVFRSGAPRREIDVCFPVDYHANFAVAGDDAEPVQTCLFVVTSCEYPASIW
jgi:hypothetical protein